MIYGNEGCDQETHTARGAVWVQHEDTDQILSTVSHKCTSCDLDWQLHSILCTWFSVRSEWQTLHVQVSVESQE